MGTDFLLYLLYLSQLGLFFFLLLISTWWVNCVGKQRGKTENAENMMLSSARSVLQFISVFGVCKGLDGKVCCARGSCLWSCSFDEVLNCEQEWWALSWLVFMGGQMMCGFWTSSPEAYVRVHCHSWRGIDTNFNMSLSSLISIAVLWIDENSHCISSFTWHGKRFY